MGCGARSRYLLLPACLLPILGCIYHPQVLDVPPAGGKIQIEVLFTQPHTALTLTWWGKYLGCTSVCNSFGTRDRVGESRGPQDTAALTRISADPSVELAAGRWEFTIIGSVGDADAFPPIICRQEIFSGKIDPPMLLQSQEGGINCTAQDGYEDPPKTFLWGERAGILANSIYPSSTEAYPDVADNSGALRLLFFLVNPSTLPQQVDQIKAGFYTDNNGQPGNLVGSFTLPLEAKLAERGRLDTTVTPHRLKGATWVWFDLVEELGVNAVNLQQGQTFYLGLLDLCPPGPQVCDTGTKVFHFYSGNTRTVFQSPNFGETNLPDPWPAGAASYPNTAPAVAFGVSRQ